MLFHDPSFKLLGSVKGFEKVWKQQQQETPKADDRQQHPWNSEKDVVY